MNDGGAILFGLAFYVVWGAVCAAIAHSKGRNAVGWFFVGFFLQCIGLIIILCLSNLNEENAKWAMQNEEQRRMREQLRQEQMKFEALRQHTSARLDVHDQELGIDTKASGPALPGAAPVSTMQPSQLPYQPPGETTPIPTDASVEWYYVENKVQQGPVGIDMIRVKVSDGTIQRDTLVWNENMTKWEAAGGLPLLNQYFLS